MSVRELSWEERFAGLNKWGVLVVKCVCYKAATRRNQLQHSLRPWHDLTHHDLTMIPQRLQQLPSSRHQTPEGQWHSSNGLMIPFGVTEMTKQNTFPPYAFHWALLSIQSGRRMMQCSPEALRAATLITTFFSFFLGEPWAKGNEGCGKTDTVQSELPCLQLLGLFLKWLFSGVWLVNSFTPSSINFSSSFWAPLPH